ncbi:DUF2802 domain-containing protein [Psychromonas sp. SR45-3]|uniref:DUF2802 domain-containing protein n=1 Tax=Psychromonas sp. SR45-3 TaxID=2760930 RepID=UPI0015FA54F1|nr:DUF2802 domain-containing protein [Psychromonas sp. SR45-3]MBB1271662.1 DUF2802 domain-containing protein [Psychromonas sp. SR45-3]
MFLQYIPWLALLLAIIFFITMLFLFKKMSKKTHSLEVLVKSLLAQQEAHKKQFIEIHSGAVGMGRKLQQLDVVVRKTQENQVNLVASAPENRLYTRAMKMVELGASVEELMTDCELPRAEAELLVNLHRK